MGRIIHGIDTFRNNHGYAQCLAKYSPPHRDLVLLLLATLSMAGGLLAAIQIYWIRYSIPLIPFVCIWIAYGLTSLTNSRSYR